MGRIGKLVTLFHAAKKWASDAENVHESMIQTTDYGRRIPYYRLNVQEGLGSMKLDEWKKDRGVSKITRLKWKLMSQECPKPVTTLEYIRAKTEEELRRPDTIELLNRCAAILVESRRLRLQIASLWERQVLCVRFKCPAPGKCNRRTGDITDRDKFQRHLLKHHPDMSTNLDQIISECTLPYDHCII
jgi:hypothetical protein